MTIHDFDLARFFLGEVVEVYATGANVVADYIAELGDIDSAVVVLRGADGTLCHITNSRHSAFGYDQRLEAFGSDGMLSVGNQHPSSVRLSNANQTEAAREYLNFFLDRYTPAYRAELDHLISAIEQGGQPSPGFADGRGHLLWPTRRSRASGRVRWSGSGPRLMKVELAAFGKAPAQHANRRESEVTPMLLGTRSSWSAEELEGSVPGSPERPQLKGGRNHDHWARPIGR